jgi:hypothetical protein
VQARVVSQDKSLIEGKKKGALRDLRMAAEMRISI